MTLIRTNTRIGQQKLGDALFKGDIVVFSIPEVLSPFIHHTRSLIERDFQLQDPEHAHNYLDVKTYLARAELAKKRFENDDKAKRLFFRALSHCGIREDTNYYDRLVLRIVPCEAEYDNGRQASVKHHRDTWGSNIDCQINWWLPIYPLTKGRSIAIYPEYWQQKVNNTTSSWSFSQYLEEKNATPDEEKIHYPSAPQALEGIDENASYTPEIQPGDILSFSSAHLHGSKTNQTSKFRFSVEIRTVAMSDLYNKKGAPNIDNALQTPMYQWFKRIKDDEKLVFEPK
ncbi:hypothetical protein LRP49_02710 [Enterovibrio sp. ZSDZ35]|uniref:Phytanoyl-CoA dioxygenase (PhyH) n=1 Tax=Enterovibrio qingdaonensis TaxID=2899818 RepID=A0ABT5QGJ3_9GAMM|nr:hypothetical protein [Enterovibrio sp. ZSDZ35]MDD1780101.1 hypothetical protein [Enterovibrio sp. ZSDZ35]